MTNGTNDRPTLAPAALAVLDALRRRIRRYVWVEGIATAFVWLGVAFWASLAVDWFFEPSVPVRAAMLAAVSVVLVAIVLRWIVRRLLVRITDGNAAMILERRFPQLNDSLLTAVLLTDAERSPDAGDASDEALRREMLARTCREAESRLASLDLREVFDARPVRRSCVAAGLLAAGIVFFAAAFFSAFGVWAQRSLALSDRIWPRSTRLEVEGFVDGVRKVARGADCEILARADAAMPLVPQVVEVRYRTDEGSRGRATMDRRGIARSPEDEFQEYAYVFRSVLADIRFDVVGGDDRVSDLWIQVVASPTISQMTLDCELPKYIGRAPATIPASGVMQLPMGARVTIRAAAANKDLVRVEVGSIVDDRPAPVKAIEGDALAPDRRGFSLALEPLLKETTLLFSLIDADGIRSRDPDTIRLVLAPVADQPPHIAVQLDGIGSAVTPNARVPVAGRISDDYGIAGVWFEHAVDQEKPGTRAIEEFSEPPTEVILTDRALETQELGATPGQKLLISVKASDRCDLGSGPNSGGSERWVLDVVTPEQLRAMLDGRELVLRQRFDRMIQEMTETRDLLARLSFDAAAVAPDAASLPDGDGADTLERRRALRLLRVEGATANCRKSAQEVLGVADAFDDIRKQLVNNRIDTEELKNRLQAGIADPLRAIADPMLPDLERRLDGLRGVLDDPEKGPAVRDDTRRQADEILLAMQKVRDRMLDLEGFNEAIDLLRGIIRMQDDLRGQTQERHKQKIRDLREE